MPNAPDPEWAKELRRRLQPDAVRTNLVLAGLFMAGWEMLKGEVQEQVRGFYLMEVWLGLVADEADQPTQRARVDPPDVDVGQVHREA